MGFLFGDLTPAPFSTNFLEELRDAVEVCAALAERDQVIATADARREALRRAASADLDRVEHLVCALLEAGRAAGGPKDSPSAALAATIEELVAQRRAVADSAIGQKLAEDVRALEAETLEARGDYFPILERYLLTRDPPGSIVTLRIDIVATAKKDERKYNAVLGGRWGVGLEWSTELSVPEDGTWSEPVRVAKLADGLSIVAPQLSGLIKKEVKHKKQRLDRHLVTKIVDDGSTMRTELRADAGEGDGFDLVVTFTDQKVAITKTGDPDDASVGPFEVEPEDAASLLDFAKKLRAAANDLPRKRLIAASFDEVPFDGNNTTAQPHLVQLVGRFVEKLAPTIQEIAVRSRSDEELVLRRLLDDGRREEFFMPKARIRELLESLDADHRNIFAPATSALDATPGETRREGSMPDTLVRSEVSTSDRPYVRRQSGSMGAVAVAVPASPPVPKDTDGVNEDPVLEVNEVESEEPVEEPAAATPEEQPVAKAEAKPEPKPEEKPVEAPVAKAEPKSEAPPPSAATTMLVATLKHIQSLAKDGQVDEAYRQYALLFASQPFLMCRHEDQRQAIRLMFSAKGPPSQSDEAKAAYKAVLPLLQALVLAQREPGDYEMLGMAYVGLAEPEKATGIYKKALEIERERDPGSDLCGTLMRRVSEL